MLKNTMAGLKHSLSDRDWQEIARDPFDHYPEQDMWNLIDRTVEHVKKIARGKRVGFGWSGGKDSVVLDWVMRQAGVTRCVLVVTDGLEYPQFETWARDNAPQGLETVTVPVDRHWLLSRPHLLFPTGKHASAWFPHVQQAGQNMFFREQNLDAIAIGRRRKDGNYIGPKGTNIYTGKNGVTRWSPIHDWPHEAVFGLMQREQLPVAPCYSWPRGYTVGTGPWPARGGTRDHDQGFRETWAIDPDIVRKAARWLPQAKQWLQQESTNVTA